MALSIGDQAPDFTLNDQTRSPVTLSDFRGKKDVLLVFYPLAFSGVCTGEMCTLRDSIDSFRSDEVETLAISVDSSAATAAWAAKEGYEFPLLSDFWPHGAVAERYGVFDANIGLAMRGTFLIDKQGVIRFAEVNPIPEARDQQRWRHALAELGGAG
jgi:peroxiredoxin (alkyl hydroperoxide reductase subunit C)